MNKFKLVARRVFFTVYYGYSRIVMPIIYKRSFERGQLRYLSKEDFEVWKRSMLSMLKEYCSAGYYFQLRHVIYTFANARIEAVRKTAPCSAENPIVVLCVKNDLRRIQMLVEHYRSLGVEKFAFMDNGSEDGTFEWLLEQPDIDLYRIDSKGRTNIERMKQGLAPQDSNGISYELHHIGQKKNGTLAILSQSEHDNPAIHGFLKRTEAHATGTNWDKERQAFWKAYAAMVG